MTEPSKTDPEVEELNRRGAISREIGKVVSEQINAIVEQLRATYPDHDNVIRRHLEAESHRLLSEAETAKRLARDEAKKNA